MELQMRADIAPYKSRSQAIRVVTESWMSSNVYCPCCGSPAIHRFPNNRPVADFYCPLCREEFELKSKAGGSAGVIADGAYATMIARIQAENNPNFFFLHYDRLSLKVHDLTVIPKYFFTADIIEKRNPLAGSARRAGWVGCNIRIGKIPDIGKIELIKDSRPLPIEAVVEKYKMTAFLAGYKADMRGWLLDTLNCIERIEAPEFSLDRLYGFADELQQKYPNNHHVRDKMRQQLQVLRDRGLVAFVGRGHYRRLF